LLLTEEEKVRATSLTLTQRSQALERDQATLERQKARLEAGRVQLDRSEEKVAKEQSEAQKLKSQFEEKTAETEREAREVRKLQTLVQTEEARLTERRSTLERQNERLKEAQLELASTQRETLRLRGELEKGAQKIKKAESTFAARAAQEGARQAALEERLRGDAESLSMQRKTMDEAITELDSERRTLQMVRRMHAHHHLLPTFLTPTCDIHVTHWLAGARNAEGPRSLHDQWRDKAQAARGNTG
jgi:fused signal recognition particle receptor